jgi:hypothetical protein
MQIRNRVEEVALKHGMISLPDTSGTNIFDVQILIPSDWQNIFSKANSCDKRTVLIIYGCI